VTRIVGRYALHQEIAHGGMATVHLGQLRGEAGFSRVVAIKRLHPQFAKDPEFLSMFLDEARVAARIRHPNVVSTLDVVSQGEELFLVMDYVQGESLSRVMHTLKGRGERVPPAIASAIAIDTLNGLHAAHEARDERGKPLDVIHRDVSPQNVLVAVDGVARVLDFGVAKAAGRLQTTRDGQIKGKLAYMAPEQFRNEPIDRTVDVRAAAIVLWEALTGQRMMSGGNDAAIVERVLYGAPTPATEIVPSLPAAIDSVIERALATDPKKRFATAKDLAIALEQAIPRASVHEVSEWLPTVAGETLEKRAAMVSAIETASPAPELAPEQAASAQTIVDERPTRSSRPISIGIVAVLVALGGAAFFLARKSEAPKLEEPPAAAAPSPSMAITASTSAAPVVSAPPPEKPEKPPEVTSSGPKPKPAAVAPKKPATKPAPTPQTTAKPKSMLPAGLPDDRD
jgi:serine/threonine-protein kinase